MYLIVEHYDYEEYKAIGACKSKEKAKEIILQQCEKIKDSYKNNERYDIIYNIIDNNDDYEVRMYRIKTDKNFNDGLHDRIWYESFYIESLEILD